MDKKGYIELRQVDKPWPIDRAVYLQVGTYILSEAFRQGAVAGTRLPSEDALAELCSVSRTTIRRATSELEANGYLYRRRGVGHFYAGRAVHSEFISAGLSEPDALFDVARMTIVESRLKQPASPAVLRRMTGVSFVDFFRLTANEPDKIAIVMDLYLPAGHLPQAAGAGEIASRLAARKSEQRSYLAIAATNWVAAYLGIQANDPAIFCELTYLDENHVAFATADIWRPGRHFALRLAMS